MLRSDCSEAQLGLFQQRQARVGQSSRFRSGGCRFDFFCTNVFKQVFSRDSAPRYFTCGTTDIMIGGADTIGIMHATQIRLPRFQRIASFCQDKLRTATRKRRGNTTALLCTEWVFSSAPTTNQAPSNATKLVRKTTFLELF